MVFLTMGEHIWYMVLGLLKETKMTKVKVIFSPKITHMKQFLQD
jgi:hypothetical protein